MLQGLRVPAENPNSEFVGPELVFCAHGFGHRAGGKWWGASMWSTMTACKHFMQATEMSTKNGNVELGNVVKDFEAEGCARAVGTKLMTGIEATFTLVSFLLNVAQMTLPLLLCSSWLVCSFSEDAGGRALHEHRADAARGTGHIGFSEHSLPRTTRIGPGVPLAPGCCVLLFAFSDRVCAYIGLLGLMSSLASVSILVTLVDSGWPTARWSEDTAYIASLQYVPTSFAMILFTAGTHPLICIVLHST